MTFITDGNRAYAAAYGSGIQPDPWLLIDQWAEEYARIPRGAGAEHGKYHVERTPYAREVMRCLSPSDPCRRVVAKVASQLFKTQVAINWLMATIHQAPGNILVLEPTDKIAKRISARIDKTILDIPEVRSRVAKPRSRDSRNTMDTKEFDGGTLYITTAGSAANLAEVPVRYIYCDEIDRWVINVDGEGSPRQLAETRASTFGRHAKIYYTSSPTMEGASEIDDLYQQSDQREYEVPCPHCAAPLVLEWGQMRWSEDAALAWYECPHCAGHIEERHKPAMMAAGTWRATAPGDGETVGFHLNTLYAPPGWTSWRQLVQQFLAASVALESGDMDQMQVFYNTRLALTWDVVRERVKSEQIAALAEPFKLGTVPDGALALTAAVDVQGNRLELLGIGWGPGLERWTVAQHIVTGEPTDRATWDALERLLTMPLLTASGQPMVYDAVAIDSGAYTEDVYEFVRARRRRRVGTSVQEVCAIKGSSTQGPILRGQRGEERTWRGKIARHGLHVHMVGVDAAKDWLYPRLLATTGPGAMHYSRDLEPEWFEQLTVEAKVIRFFKGRRRASWEKINGQRNEAFDLLVYNLWAAYHLELHKRPESWWARRREALNPPVGDLFAAQPEDRIGGLAMAPRGADPASDKAKPAPTVPAARHQRPLIR